MDFGSWTILQQEVCQLVRSIVPEAALESELSLRLPWFVCLKVKLARDFDWNIRGQKSEV